MYFSSYKSSFGEIILVGTRDFLTHLNFIDQKHYLYGLTGKQLHVSELPIFKLTKRWLDVYFSGDIPNFTIPINPIGTNFQKKVWSLLSLIPYGSTRNYGDISRLIDPKKPLYRAVGSAISYNPILIILPCHRVISSNGSLGGYAAGVDIKHKLHKLELSNSSAKSIITF